MTVGGRRATGCPVLGMNILISWICESSCCLLCFGLRLVFLLCWLEGAGLVINFLMSDEFLRCWIFAFFRQFRMNGVLLRSHCFMDAAVLCCQSSRSIAKGKRSCVRTSNSC